MLGRVVSRDGAPVDVEARDLLPANSTPSIAAAGLSSWSGSESAALLGSRKPVFSVPAEAVEAANARPIVTATRATRAKLGCSPKLK